jgi:hypothetical protein
MSYTLNPRLKNKTNNYCITIHYKDIEGLFNMTAENACNHLGISKTSLKKICRHFNISKWPYRRLCKNNTVKPAIAIKKISHIKDPEMYNDLSFLTGFNINENPYELEKILLDFY